MKEAKIVTIDGEFYCPCEGYGDDITFCDEKGEFDWSGDYVKCRKCKGIRLFREVEARISGEEGLPLCSS